MKKTLFLAVMAGAALAGCVKNEPIANSDGSPGRITFDAPVVSVPTRAEEIFGNYPGDKDFAVYALYHEVEYEPFAFDEPFYYYMTDVRCTADNQTTPTKWVPETNYYWPKRGFLTFAAYAPARIATGDDENISTGKVWNGATVDWNVNGFTFTDFEVNNDPTKQIDLLYSGRVYDQNKSTMVENKPYDGVTIPFKHALSSIVFTAKTQERYPDVIIKLTNIMVRNVVKKGTFAQNLTADKEENSSVPSWTLDAANQDNVEDFYTVFSKPDGEEITHTEAFVNGPVDEVGDSYDATNNPPTDPAFANNGKRRSDLIVIPQSLDREGDDDVLVLIEYTIQNGDETPIPQGHTLQLAVTDTNEWEMGKRYTYHITIGLDKIYFNPQVTNWEDVTGDAIQIN